MNRDVATLLALVLGMAIYLGVTLPLFKGIARLLTGRAFRFELRPTDIRSKEVWRDVAWSGAALLAAMALMAGVMEWLGWGP